MPRKGENIYKRKDGRWEGRYLCGYKEDGTSKYRSVYAHSYREVKEKLKNSSNTISKKHISHNTLYDICEEWLKLIKNKHKISTYNKYKNICDLHIIPTLGKLKIELIENKHIESLLVEKKHLSSKTRSDILCVIKLIFTYARQKNYKLLVITQDLYVHKENMNSIRVLSLGEQKKLCDYLLSNTNYCKIGIFLALYTGVRIGELCALKCSDIDFDRALLQVNKTMQRVQTEDDKSKTKIIITSPKTKCSIRSIPLPDFVMDILIKHYKNLSPSYYLLTGNAKYIEPRTLSYHFKKHLKFSNLEDVKFHVIRHTFATRCIELGIDIKSLSEILGHSNTNITLNRYVHSSVELKRQNMNKLSQLYN